MASRPLYQLGHGGIVMRASSASIATTASTSLRSQASAKRVTIWRSSLSPSARSVACCVRPGTRCSIALWARLQRAVDGDRRHLERLGGLPSREAEDVSQHEDGPLPRGQVLERGGEGELDALTLFVARVRAEHRGFDSELGVGVGLEPDRLGERLAEGYMWIGRWTVVDREHALGPLVDHAQAGVGGDPI